jgi:hypothetical protein
MRVLTTRVGPHKVTFPLPPHIPLSCCYVLLPFQCALKRPILIRNSDKKNQDAAIHAQEDPEV